MEDWTISSGPDPEEIDMLESVEVLAYSIAAILGDGHLGITINYDRVLGIHCSDIEVISTVTKEINDTFGKDYHVLYRDDRYKDGKRMFHRSFNDKRIWSYFWYVTEGKQRFPSAIFHASDDAKKRFVAGLMDTDGWVDITRMKYSKRNGEAVDRPRYRVGFANTKMELVSGLATLLHMLGVNVGKIYTKERANSQTIYTIMPNIRDFIERGLYFLVWRKDRRLSEYIQSMSIYSDIMISRPETMYAAPINVGDDIVQPWVKA